MAANNLYRVLMTYRGCEICQVNYQNPLSKYIGVVINNQLSNIALISSKAAQNVIDTHLRYKQK
jgi:hypothetical protein